MAAIGKIRSWGPILVVVIGLALFAFIAEELVRSCNSGSQAEARRVATINGENIDYADYQKMVDEYKNAKGNENITDEDFAQLWQTFVTNKLVANEAAKLGLTVTDEEMQNIFREGTNQVLLQYAPQEFRNQQTGRFDAAQLNKFLDMYKKGAQNPQMKEAMDRLYAYWIFVEHTVREQILNMKYQSLLAHCFIANDVEAKMAFDEHVQEADIELAAFPYSSVKESEAKVTEEDIQKKYEETKERYRIFEEMRDVKYVRLQLTASDADRKDLTAKMQQAAAGLDSTAAVADIVRTSSSDIPYLGIPLASSMYPQDIAQVLDSVAVGAVVGPFETKTDNTLNVVRILAKEQLPDSVQVRIINAATEQTADSIHTALKAGANFAEIAKKYNQTGDSIWLASESYLRDPQTGAFPTSLTPDNKSINDCINHAAVGEIRNIKLTSGNLIIQILAHKAMKQKVTAAIIKREIAFSKQTRTDNYNKFSTFATQSKNGIKEMETSAKKNSYTVEELPNVRTAMRAIPYNGIMDPATGRQKTTKLSAEALKWLFKAKEGEVSGVFECGTNRDEYVLLAVTKIYDKGYVTLDNKSVREQVKAEALRDKQAEVILKKLNGVKSIAAAKAKGGIVSEVPQVTFDMPAAVGGAYEPAVSGAVAATKAGQFVSHPVKGNNGVYVFQVKKKANSAAQYDAKSYKARLAQTYLGMAMNTYMYELVKNAGIKDNRYLFSF